MASCTTIEDLLNTLVNEVNNLKAKNPTDWLSFLLGLIDELRRFITDAINSLTNLINSTRDALLRAISDAIEALKALLMAAINALAGRVDKEVNDRQGGDKELQGEIDALKSRLAGDEAELSFVGGRVRELSGAVAIIAAALAIVKAKEEELESKVSQLEKKLDQLEGDFVGAISAVRDAAIAQITLVGGTAAGAIAIETAAATAAITGVSGTAVAAIAAEAATVTALTGTATAAIQGEATVATTAIQTVEATAEAKLAVLAAPIIVYERTTERIENFREVPVEKPYPVPQIVPYPIPQPIVVPEPAPYPVPTPYPVPVPEPLLVPYPEPVLVPQPTPVPVPQPYPVPGEIVTVPTPYPVPTPMPVPTPTPVPGPLVPVPFPVPQIERIEVEKPIYIERYVPGPTQPPIERTTVERITDTQIVLQRDIVEVEKPVYIDRPTIQVERVETEKTVVKLPTCEELLTFTECLPKQPETELVTLPVIECEDGKPNKSYVSATVIKGSLDATEKAKLDKTAAAAEQACKDGSDSNGAVLSIPEWWELRPEYERPQLCILFGLKDSNTGKVGAAKYTITIPHYKGDKPEVSPIKSYRKGSHIGILTLDDNSKVIVYANDQKEAERILTEARKVIQPAQLRNAIAKYGLIKGRERATGELFAKELHYYEKGLSRGVKPTWIVRLKKNTSDS